MTTNAPAILNTMTLQEKIVVTCVALLFVAQPFTFADSRVAMFALAIMGFGTLLFHRQIYKRTGFWQFTTIVLLLGIPGILSFWNTYSPQETTKFIFGLLAFYAAGVTIILHLNNKKVADVLMMIIAITSMLWVFDATIQFIIGRDILGIPIGDGLRVSGPFSDGTHFGMLLAVTLPVTLKWLTRYHYSAQFIYVIILGFVLYVTGVRTDWVTYLVVVVLFYSWTKRGRVLLFWLVPILTIVCWIAAMYSPLAAHKSTQFFSIPTTYEAWNDKLSDRFYIWEAGMNMGSQNLLTGVGAKAFNHAYATYKSENDPFKEAIDGQGGAHHAHHPWIAVFAETGLVGVVSLCTVVVLLFILTIRSPRGLNFYHYPWMLSFVLILNPVNSMPPIFKTWWVPIVLLIFVAHIADLERNSASVNVADESL